MAAEVTKLKKKTTLFPFLPLLKDFLLPETELFITIKLNIFFVCFKELVAALQGLKHFVVTKLKTNNTFRFKV